jgi:hypothetical protein
VSIFFSATMVVLAAAVLTKSGKPLISRQFVEMSRIRIEGLLAAFPKLMGTGKQYTYLETDTVRYVYQPIENLFLVLITNRSSNIVEDLETLRLLGRIVPDYCPKLEEEDVTKKAFELLFAFDEVINLGYRDSTTLEQVKTCLEMDSNEERIALANKDARVKDAIAHANAKAKQFSKERRIAKGGISSLDPGAILSSISDEVTSGTSSTPVVVPVDDRPTPKTAPSKGVMALGKKGGKDDLVSKMVKAGELEVSTQPIAPAKPSAVANRPAVRMDNVHLKSDERISAVLNRDGGFQSVEVKGDLFLTVSDSSCASIRVCLNREQNNNYAWKTHPNINKTPWTKDRVLCPKDPSKPFPVGTALGIVRWRLQNTADFVPPISVNCWPGDSAVTIEYECERPELVLTQVQISIPMGGATPEVGDVDCGTHSYDAVRQQLTWTIDRIDRTNAQGSMEVNLDSALEASAFFPVDIQFFAESCVANVAITDVLSNDTGLSVPYSSEVLVGVDSYQVV